MREMGNKKIALGGCFIAVGVKKYYISKAENVDAFSVQL